MFRVTGQFRDNQRTEITDTVSAALTWVEEFEYLGATEISVSDDLRSYQVAELSGIVKSLRDPITEG